jgi:hypothetical protein
MGTPSPFSKHVPTMPWAGQQGALSPAPGCCHSLRGEPRTHSTAQHSTAQHSTAHSTTQQHIRSFTGRLIGQTSAEACLCACIAALSSVPVPLESASLVRRHAAPGGIARAELDCSVSVASTGGLVEALRCLRRGFMARWISGSAGRVHRVDAAVSLSASRERNNAYKCAHNRLVLFLMGLRLVVERGMPVCRPQLNPLPGDSRGPTGKTQASTVASLPTDTCGVLKESASAGYHKPRTQRGRCHQWTAARRSLSTPSPS